MTFEAWWMKNSIDWAIEDCSTPSQVGDLLKKAYEAGYNTSWEDNYKDWVKFGYVIKP